MTPIQRASPLVGFLVLLLRPSLLAGQALTADQIQQALLAQAPQATLDLSKALADDDGNVDPIQVIFVNADLGDFSLRG
jgi:hypothetical protein